MSGTLMATSESALLTHEMAVPAIASAPLTRRRSTAAARWRGNKAQGAACSLPAAAAAGQPAAPAVRHVAELRQLCGAAPLLPNRAHYHHTAEVWPRRGGGQGEKADKQRRQTWGGAEEEAGKQGRQTTGGRGEETGGGRRRRGGRQAEETDKQRRRRGDTEDRHVGEADRRRGGGEDETGKQGGGAEGG